MSFLRILLSLVLAIAVPLQGGVAAAMQVCSQHQPGTAAPHAGGHPVHGTATPQAADPSAQAMVHAPGSQKAPAKSACKCAQACCQPLAAFSHDPSVGFSPPAVEAFEVRGQLLSWAEPVPHKPPKA